MSTNRLIAELFMVLFGLFGLKSPDKTAVREGVALLDGEAQSEISILEGCMF